MWVAVRNGTAAVLPLGRPLPICGRRRPATSHRLVCRQPCSTGQPAAQAARYRVARWLQLRVDVPALTLFLGHLLADLAPALDVAVLEEVLEPHGDEQGPCLHRERPVLGVEPSFRAGVDLAPGAPVDLG